MCSHDTEALCKPYSELPWEQDRVTPGVYYTIQHRWTHESPWLKPEGKLKKRKDAEWGFSSFDHFGVAFNPHTGKGNNWRPKWKAADANKQELWQRTRHTGWTRLKYALKALKNARKMDAAGEFDCRDSYTNKTQAARHEFRVVKCSYFSDYSVVDLNDPDIVDELV
jgi:hypothetical protein